MVTRRRKFNPNLIDEKITTGKFDVTDYAKTMIETKGSLRGTQTNASNMTIKSVENWLGNVMSNHDSISSAMEAQVVNDGLLKATMNYLSTSLTLNHTIYPSVEGMENSKIDVSLEDYLGVASYFEKYNLKFFVPYFIYRTLIKGTSFFYEVSDSKGVAYLEFPNNLCRISVLENGVYRWMLDATKIKGELLNNPSMPKEIVSAIQSGDRSNTNKWVDGKYLILSDKAVAFTFDMTALTQGGIAVSELVSMLPSSIIANGIKKNINVKDELDAVRIIHGQIPSDSQGVIKMSSKDAATFSNLLKQDLPDGIEVAVTPFELDSVPLNGSGTTKAFDNVRDAQKQVLQSVGLSPQMFGEDTKSSNAIKLGIVRDMALIYKKILPVFTNYYNSILEKAKTKSKNKWKIKILEQNYFSFEDDVRVYKEAVSLGGSRTDYLASIGMTPMEVYTKLYMEQNVLDIDSLMKPKEMSYTLSGSNSVDSGEVGRPKTNNPSDDTERIADSE